MLPRFHCKKRSFKKNIFKDKKMFGVLLTRTRSCVRRDLRNSFDSDTMVDDIFSFCTDGKVAKWRVLNKWVLILDVTCCRGKGEGKIVSCLSRVL